MIDLDYYTWRVRTLDEDGVERLLIPWSDPMRHEYDFGYVYDTAEEAIDHKNDDEEAAQEDWVLVHYTGEIVEVTA